MSRGGHKTEANKRDSTTHERCVCRRAERRAELLRLTIAYVGDEDRQTAHGRHGGRRSEADAPSSATHTLGEARGEAATIDTPARVGRTDAMGVEVDGQSMTERRRGEVRAAWVESIQSWRVDVLLFSGAAVCVMCVCVDA